jgi:hypothetical protein
MTIYFLTHFIHKLLKTLDNLLIIKLNFIKIYFLYLLVSNNIFFLKKLFLNQKNQREHKKYINMEKYYQNYLLKLNKIR